MDKQILLVAKVRKLLAKIKKWEKVAFRIQVKCITWHRTMNKFAWPFFFCFLIKKRFIWSLFMYRDMWYSTCMWHYVRIYFVWMVSIEQTIPKVSSSRSSIYNFGLCMLTIITFVYQLGTMYVYVYHSIQSSKNMQKWYTKTDSFFFVLMTCSIEYLDVNLAIILTTNFAILSKSSPLTWRFSKVVQ